MTKPQKKAEAVKGAAKKVRQKTRAELDKAKEKVDSKAAVSELFRKFLEDFDKLSTKERIKRIGKIIFVATIGKIIGFKQKMEKMEAEGRKKDEAKEKGEKDQKKDDKKKKQDEEPEEDSEFEEVDMDAAPANDNALPEDLDGTKWSEENLMKCKTVEALHALMKANGFVLDKQSGNYVNPRWLSPAKILHEPMVKHKIGRRMVTLKRSVMERLVKADKAMFEAEGEHIEIGQDFRTNLYQLELYHRLRPKGGRVASPGHSFHEVGQALDAPNNWEKAQKYLWAVGFVGGKQPIGLKGDANHFSIGEIRMTEKRLAALKDEGIEMTKKAA